MKSGCFELAAAFHQHEPKLAAALAGGAGARVAPGASQAVFRDRYIDFFVALADELVPAPAQAAFARRRARRARRSRP